MISHYWKSDSRVSGLIKPPGITQAASIASMEKIRRMIATYKATFFINHYREQTNTLELLPAFYD
jgi:hypothetical protein